MCSTSIRRFTPPTSAGLIGPRLLALHGAIKPQLERYEQLYIRFWQDLLPSSVKEHHVIVQATRALTTENGEIDPRSATVKLNTAPADASSVIYISAKYNAASLTAGESIPLPVARYAEAQLIIAEAQGGASAVTIINAMRASVNLRFYVGPTDPASIKSLIASERQRVLFLEGFRGFDIERFSLPLVPAIGSPYQSGDIYGATVCLPLPDIERRNNPNIVVSKLISGVQGQFPPP